MTSSKDISWIINLDENLLNYLDSLQTKEFEYLPMKNGLTREGNAIKLGFSCFAFKIKYILNDKEIKSKNFVKNASNYLNAYQQNISGFPSNSYIDNSFLYFHQNPKLKILLKNNIKKAINLVDNERYLEQDTLLKNYIRAETKQAISTIYQIGETNNQKYNNFPSEREKIIEFLDAQNWRYPWNAGAQFSSLCVFSKTQLKENNFKSVKNSLENYIKKTVDKDTGAYFKGKTPENREIINGAMKVISGLDWLNTEIHYPENLIDFCLRSNVNLEGCDIVDIVYVLYKCSLQTNYRKKDIDIYLNNLIGSIKLNYIEKDGAFSYYFKQSQKYYYGLEISKGLNTADIHGSLLLLWALSMIFQISDKFDKDWNILKP